MPSGFDAVLPSVADCMISALLIVPIQPSSIVERVVAHVQADEIVDCEVAAEHFDAVVIRRIDLEVVDDGIAADAAERNAVQFVAVADRGAGVLDDDVLETARTVRVVVPP